MIVTETEKKFMEIKLYATVRSLLLVCCGSITGIVGAQCLAVDVASPGKSIAISGMQFIYPEQSRLGVVRDLEYLLPARIVTQLRQSGQHHVFDLSRWNLADPGYQGTDLPGMVTSHSQFGGVHTKLAALQRGMELPDSQFLFRGEISDVELATNLGASGKQRFGARISSLFSRNSNQPRSMQVSTILTNEFTGEVVYQKSYRLKANWSFELPNNIGARSAVFWGSEYGQQALKLVNDLVADLATALQCELWMARVASTDQQELTILAGSQQGVEIGQGFGVIKVNSIDQLTLAVPDVQVSVVAVSTNGSVIEVDGGGKSQVRVGDLVVFN